MKKKQDSMYQKLAEKYEIDEEDIKYLLDKFSSLENFYDFYITNIENHNIVGSNIEDRRMIKLAKGIIKEAIEVEGKSFRGYDLLWYDLRMLRKFPNVQIFYSSEKLRKAIEELLDDTEKFVLKEKYGLVDGAKPKSLEAIAKEVGLTRQTIRMRLGKIKEKLFKYFTQISNQEFICISPDFIDILESKETEKIENIIKDIRLQNGDLSENLGKLKKIEEGICSGKSKEIAKLKKMDALKVKNLGFSSRTYYRLSSADITFLSDLEKWTPERLLEIKNLGTCSFDEIVEKMREHGIHFKAEKSEDELEDGITITTTEIGRETKCVPTEAKLKAAQVETSKKYKIIKKGEIE